jgi:hypothetical protein
MRLSLFSGHCQPYLQQILNKPDGLESTRFPGNYCISRCQSDVSMSVFNLFRNAAE